MMFRSAAKLAALAAVLTVPPWFIPAARAQAPELVAALPAGGPRGATVAVRVSGRDLRGATALLSGQGVRVAGVSADPAGDAATVRIALAPDATLGPRELRFATPRGVSNPLRLWVGVYPNAPEPAPASARPLPAKPAAINGCIAAPGEQDTYAFEASAGETWVCDVVAQRIRSPLVPALELRDAAGAVLASARAVGESDPRIVQKLEKAGRYTLTLRDALGGGGPGFVYRLLAGRLPVVTSFLPRGEKAGRPVEVEVSGVNLGKTYHATVRIPPGVYGSYWTTIPTAVGPALPFRLLVDSSLVAGITETDATMPLPLDPGSLDGIFQVYPRTRFYFQAGPTDHFIFDLLGERIGSQIDGALAITDTSGKTVAEADNTSGLGRDARVEFTPPAGSGTGLYVVEARNVTGKVGPECFYRLSVQRQAPDFRLYLDVDRLQVEAGGAVTAAVKVERLGGFAGAVRLGAAALPKGVVLAAATIAADQTSAEVTLTAAPSARPAATPITLRGAAVIAGKTVVHQVVPREAWTPRAPGSAAGPEYRPVDLLPLAVVARASFPPPPSPPEAARRRPSGSPG